MQKAIISENQIKKLIALSLMMLIIVTPISVYAQVEGYTDQENLGEAITVNVAGYEPAVIKSSQIEATDIPVYVYLKGLTMGSLFGLDVEKEPFIAQPKIKSVVVYPSSDTSSQYLSGNPLWIGPNRNSLNLDNLGYLIVVLKQIKDETKVPSNITLNMTMKIYFDFERGYGDVSSTDLVLKQYPDMEEWRKNAYENSFWNKKGYLRLVSVNNNEARIQVLDSGFSFIDFFFGQQQTALQNYDDVNTLTLSPGQIKTFTLPGTSALFNDQVRIKLNSIEDSQTSAKLKVVSYDKINYNNVMPGMKIAPGSNWIVESISTTTTSGTKDKTTGKQITRFGGRVVIKNYKGERKILYLTPSVEVGIPEITDSNLQQFKETVCDKTSVVDLNDETNLINNIKSNIDTRSENTKDKDTRPGAIKLICTAISEYEKALLDNNEAKDQAYAKLGDAYNILSEYNLNINDDATQKLSKTAKAIALYYYKRVSDPALIEKQFINLQDEVSNPADKTTYYLEDEGLSVTLIKLVEPDESEKSSAEITGGIKPNNIYYIGDEINKITDRAFNDKTGEAIRKEYIWKVSSITSSGVTLQKFDGLNPISSAYLMIGETKSIETGVDVKLNNINSAKRAYVTMMPGTGDAYSQSSFKIHIPVEKRSIRPWTNGEIDDMINKTRKQIEILNRYIEQLDQLIKPWKYICFATFALLTVKNSFAAGPDRNRARSEIMPSYDKICEDAVIAKKYETFDKCMSARAKEIDSTLDYGEQVQKGKRECTKQGDACYSQFDAYPTELKANKEKLDRLNIQNPIDSSEWEAYYECQKYEKDGYKGLPEDFKTIHQEKCNGVKENIQRKKEAFDTAVSKNQESINNADKGKDSEKIAVINFKTTYSAVIESNLPSLTPAEIKDIKEKGRSSKPSVEITNIVGQAASSSSGAFRLIDVSYKNDKPDVNFYEGAKQVMSEGSKDIPLVIISGERAYNVYEYQGKNYAAVSTVQFTDTGERTSYAKNVKAEFDDKGKPYCIPTGNGNYIKVLDWYATGDPKDCEYWNVGADGLLCSGDDNLVYGKDAVNNRRETSGLCTTTVKSVGTCKEGLRTNPIKGITYECSQKGYQVSQMQNQGHCQDVMDPEDCRTLFAVCDPVMCPASRFNLGGKWPIGSGSVVSTGIIGSLVLGLPNFPETPLPVCLPGILGGLRSIKSLLDGFVSCLESAKVNHENIGICDKIRSVGVCELLWRELINIYQLRGSLTDVISETMFKNNPSGGEYLRGYNDNIDAVSNSVDYFTNDYASSAFAAFKGRSTEELGTEICQAAIYGKMSDVGDMLDQMAEPENPPQFMATFDESPWAVNAGKTLNTPYGQQSPEQSMYSVFYHIYAGTIPEFARTGYAADGIRFAVYLRNSVTGVRVPVTTRTAGQVLDTVPYGSAKDISVERLGPSGMTQICVVINGKESCGFGKVTSDFAVNYLNDYLVKDEANRNINTADECVSDVPVSSPSLGSVVMPRQYGALSTGLVRTCSVRNPGTGMNAESYWQQVGTCGSDKQNNNLGTCWIDTRSININNIEMNDQLVQDITLNADLMANGETAMQKEYLTKTQAYSYLSELSGTLEEINNAKTSEERKDKLINLFANGAEIEENNQKKQITYQQITKFSIDPAPRSLARIERASILVMLASTIIPPVSIKLQEENIIKEQQGDSKVPMGQPGGQGGTGGGTGGTKTRKVTKEIVVQKENGKDCTDNGECTSEFCDLKGTTKKCAKKADNNQPCNDGNGCNSGICDLSLNVCISKDQVKEKEPVKEKPNECSYCGKDCDLAECKIFGNCYLSENFDKTTVCSHCPVDCSIKAKDDKLREKYCGQCQDCRWVNNQCVKKPTITSRCEDCGKGAFINCNEIRCKDLGDCYYNDANSFGECTKCPDKCIFDLSSFTASIIKTWREDDFCNQCQGCKWNEGVDNCEINRLWQQVDYADPVTKKTITVVEEVTDQGSDSSSSGGTAIQSKITGKSLSELMDLKYCKNTNPTYYDCTNTDYADYGNRDKIDYIILHHTAGSTASGAYSALNSRGRSIHYILDRDGTIYPMVSESINAIHASDYNGYKGDKTSIGIEIVNTGSASMAYTDEQYYSLNLLIGDIIRRHSELNWDDQHIIAHYQTVIRDNDEENDQDKFDPSPNFNWAKINLPNHPTYYEEYNGKCPGSFKVCTVINKKDCCGVEDKSSTTYIPITSSQESTGGVIRDLTEIDFASKKSGDPLKWCSFKPENSDIRTYSDINAKCPVSERTTSFNGGPGGLIPTEGIDKEFMNILNQLQKDKKITVVIESGVRDYEHNKWSWARLEANKVEALMKDKSKVFTSQDKVSITSQHMCGHAADFRIKEWDQTSDYSKYQELVRYLDAKYPGSKYYFAAYNTDVGRDPDNYYISPYIHADNAGGSGCNINSQTVYKSVTNTPKQSLSSPPSVSSNPPSSNTPSSSPISGSSTKKLIIVLDDGGSSRDNDDKALALNKDLKVTFAIFPKNTDSLRFSQAANTNFQVILHQPMQCLTEAGCTTCNAGGTRICNDMPQQEMTSIIQSNLDSIENEKGLNNHQGSALTSDPAASVRMANSLKSINSAYIFLDSATQVGSNLGLAYRNTKDIIKSAQRDTWIDGKTYINIIKDMKTVADKNGVYSIAIGHVGRVVNGISTIDELNKINAQQLEDQGYEFIFLSDFINSQQGNT